MKTLVVLSRNESEPGAVNLAETASFLGAKVRRCDLVNWRASPAGFSSRSDEVSLDVALAMHADTLDALLHQQDDSPDVLRDTLLSAASIFLYGVSAGIHDQLLQWLSGGVLTAVKEVDGADHAELPLCGKPFTHQLAGTQFPSARVAKSAVVIAATEATNVLPLITVSQRPTLLCVRLGSSSLFVSTVPTFPDPKQPVSHEEDIEPFYDSLLPIIIFVRAACAEFSWQGGWKAARLIIDDPLLRRSYGCLDFRRLFESLRGHAYAASVAYIPWNQSRTSRRMASFFRSAQEFALCVHGCDHTNDEYGSRDADDLLDRSRLAMARMKRHEARTGIGCEPIMVFPQGRFSSASLRALRSSKFLAAVNSTRLPVDAETAPLSLCELLLPAISHAHGFPVFGRHYPQTVFPFALDLFLGRPAFIVEHHEFFRDGFPAMEVLAAQLNACEPHLSWGLLSETIERTCWKRAASDTLWEVRFFSDKFKITNDSDRRLSYRLLKEEPEPDAVTVSLNDRLLPAVFDGGHLKIEVSLDPGETACVQLRQVVAPSGECAPKGGGYAVKVLARRILSEFRDEFLVKHPAMLVLAKRIARLLKASSDTLSEPSRKT
jgi:hypothetical protein